MDAFFAAVEQRDDPHLKGKPVVVGADPKGGKGRGVVSTCSYEARRYGIHSAMPISTAYRKCPQAVFLPVNGEKYSAVSSEIYGIFNEFTPDVEPVSIDEAFLDITGSYRIFGTPLETCALLKARIKEKTGLTASIGLAPTKMAAKIASDLKKPDGLVEVRTEKLLDFLRPLEVRKLWGLGPKAEAVLHEMGIRTIGDLARKDVKELIKTFGKTGEYFWQLANGIDDSPVETGGEAKSVSNETTFEEDTSDAARIKSALMRLCEQVSDRLRHDGIKGRTVTLKIRLEGFDTYTRAVTIAEATNFVDAIYREIERLYEAFAASKIVPPKKVRLVGVKVSNLVPATFRESLFDGITGAKDEKIHKAVDKIKEKFGGEAIFRAGGKLAKR